MRKSLTYLLLLFGLLPFAACIREEFPEPESGLLGGESWVIIPFCAGASEDVQVTTKSTLNIDAESRISNIYLFLFDGAGNRLFGDFFDSSNLDTQENVEDLSVIANNWWVTNSSNLSDPLGDTNPSTRTRGGIRIKAPNVADAQLYAVANIDGDVVNVSPERLGLVQNIAQLKEMTAVLKQDVISRNGQFTMVAGPYTVTVRNKDGSGKLQRIQSGGIDSDFDTWQMEFERVDAKIEVRVRYLSGENQKIKEFIPESWQVINVPKACTLIAPDNYASTFDLSGANEAGYKDTPPVAFESATENTVGVDTEHLHSFSFYMLENREEVKQDSNHKIPSSVDPLPYGITSRYHLRDLRLKDPSSGKYTQTEGDMWTYAPQYGTYIIIKGEVKMNISVAEQMDQALNAYVTYVFHLGDFGTSVDDFKVERNTIYTYTLTIHDVNSIQCEVYTSNPDKHGSHVFEEPNSGAMGMLNLVRQSSYTFDAHYGQRAFCFDAEMIDWAANPEDMNTRWYVKTPFGKTGSPDRLGDTDIPSNYDYQWVHFMVNSFCEDDDINATSGRRKDYADSLYKKTMANVDWYRSHPDKTPYKQNNQQYRSGVAMRDVVEFCRYMREQKLLLCNGPNGELDPTGGGSDFRPEWAPEWEAWARKQCEDGGIYSSLTPEQQEAIIIEKATRWRIWVTCYVDEYYYEEHPITHEDMRGTDFWKQFCNKPDRIMMILCDNEVSLDGDSDYTGSIITIIQHSIQTPYTLNRASLKSAWGAEVIDETFGYGWFYSMGGLNDGSNSNNSKYESTSSDKIPINDYIDLPVNTSDNGLYNSISNWQFIEGGSFKSGLKWEDYLDHEVINDEPYVRLRTHDDNGDEIHPSIASLRMACLMRNRDLNGNGTIEPGEIRWYMASSEQVYGLFLGGMGLTEMAQTYTRANANMSGKYYDPKHGYGKKNEGVKSGVDNWRLHIVTSSIYKKGESGSSTATTEQTLPHVILAEEALGGTPGAYRSDYIYDNHKKQARYSARCVRNLGMNDNINNLNDNTVIQPDQNIPEQLIKVKSFTSQNGEDLSNIPEDNKATNGKYVFDCANINEISVRFMTSRELEASDQFSEISRLYKGFETGPLIKNIRRKKTEVFTTEEIAAMAAINSYRPTSYDVLHKMLSLNQSPCPKGWRVPNIREASVMVLFGKSAKWWQNTFIISGTWSANGYNYGNQNDYNSTLLEQEKSKDTWRINRTSSTAFRYTLGQVNNDNDAIRCVRDIDP